VVRLRASAARARLRVAAPLRAAVERFVAFAVRVVALAERGARGARGVEGVLGVGL
jgi:hypothetical protein